MNWFPTYIPPNTVRVDLIDMVGQMDIPFSATCLFWSFVKIEEYIPTERMMNDLLVKDQLSCTLHRKLLNKGARIIL